MTQIVVPGTLAHAAAILAEPSAVTKAEANIDGGVADFLTSIESSLRCGEAETLLVDGDPVVQMGVCPSGKGVLGTWFVAKEAFMGLGARGILYSRRYMRRLAEKHPGMTFESRSFSPHPDTVAWFKIMGYEMVKEDGKCRIFRYKTRLDKHPTV